MRHAWLAVILFAGLWAGACHAQSCTVSSSAEAFGAYQPLDGTLGTSTATLTATCNPPGSVSVLVSYTIQLSIGGGPSYSARRMSNGVSLLGYQLYTDAAYSHVWGDGTAGTTTVTDGYTLGLVLPVTRTYTAYGRIPASQNVTTGSYADTIMVMLTY